MKTNKEIVYKEPEFYYRENRYEKTKEIFLFLADLIEKSFDRKQNIVISDHGTAAGELPYHLNKIFKNAKIKAYDVNPKLLHKGTERVPSAEFLYGSVLDSRICDKNSSDVSICVGVLQIFDSFEETIDNLIDWTKPRGRVYLHGLFNNFPIDVDIKYNHSKDRNSSIKERGWNIFSKESVSNYLETKNKIKSYKFHDFNISVALERKYDPTHNYIRSWTMTDNRGKKIITNGLNLMQPHCILEIEV